MENHHHIQREFGELALCGATSADAAGSPAGHAEPQSPVELSSAADDPSELTCAICLEQVIPTDIAVVRNCEHLYCVCCILKWAMCKERALCPQCKTPFDYLYVHRQLDGTITDFPVEESVVLLKRSVWFQAHIRTLETGGLVPASGEVRGVPGLPDPDSRLSSNREDAAYEGAYEAFYDEYDEEEELESYYFSSAAGRARVVIGNRRWGENGSVRNGRMYARPVVPPPATKAGKGAHGKQNNSAGSHAAPHTFPNPAAAARDGRAGPNSGSPAGGSAIGNTTASSSSCTPVRAPGSAQVVGVGEGSAAGGRGESANSTGCQAGPSGSAGTAAVGMRSAGKAGQSPGSTGSSAGGGKQGRRARRNARRSAADDDEDDYAY